ncbi:hypothetical protein [Cellulomonas fimi]|uniref:hypothetical protein n=1 Tax=Cellulomonas fimi TaxID=1708 RepID=UPI002359951C|nr:hypothetical protein [Cellulomonas fimi]
MSDQGSVYAAYIARNLTNERERRTALEARAGTVTSTSAALVALVATVGAWLGGSGRTYATGTVAAVVVALALFIASALLALVCGQLRPYQVPDPATLQAFITVSWTDTEVTARNNAAWLDLDTLTTLREGNGTKSRALDWSLRAQLLALAALGVAVAWELAST